MKFSVGLFALAGSITLGVVNAQICQEGSVTCLDSFRISNCVNGNLAVAKNCGNFVGCNTSSPGNISCPNSPFCVTTNGQAKCSNTPDGIQLSPGVIAAIAALSSNQGGIQPNSATIGASGSETSITTTVEGTESPSTVSAASTSTEAASITTTTAAATTTSSGSFSKNINSYLLEVATLGMLVSMLLL